MVNGWAVGFSVLFFFVFVFFVLNSGETLRWKEINPAARFQNLF